MITFCFTNISNICRLSDFAKLRAQLRQTPSHSRLYVTHTHTARSKLLYPTLLQFLHFGPSLICLTFGSATMFVMSKMENQSQLRQHSHTHKHAQPNADKLLERYLFFHCSSIFSGFAAQRLVLHKFFAALPFSYRFTFFINSTFIIRRCLLLAFAAATLW